MEAHLSTYLAEYRQETGNEPLIVAKLAEAGDTPPRDVVYTLSPGRYAHIRMEGTEVRYMVVEPVLPAASRQELADLKEEVAKEAARQGDSAREGTLEEALHGIVKSLRRNAEPTEDPVTYHLLRDMARYGPIDALLDDPNLEDIHVVGIHEVHVIHRKYGMVRTNAQFDDNLGLVRFLRILAERIGRPVSDAVPIVDAVLPNGSRLNLVYSQDVSRRGASLSLRRATDDKISITRLIQWNTISSHAAAYIWMCLENGMSMFLCGEAACGKTTTLNALLSFIDHRSKVYSAEDTPEVQPPHQIWQRLLTRETGPKASHVQMFDLLKAALRSRPDYIIVGEIRGAEGAVAFQAMQTGHPTVATFHATDPTSLVQRLGAPPINVPMSFMDNLNVILFQETRRVNGVPARRVTKIVEIAGSTAAGIMAIPVFEYDAASDSLKFTGKNNSFILEDKIATLLGLADTRKIYATLARRASILDRMLLDGTLEADDVDHVISAFMEGGEENLPFELEVAA